MFLQSCIGISPPGLPVPSNPFQCRQRWDHRFTSVVVGLQHKHNKRGFDHCLFETCSVLEMFQSLVRLTSSRGISRWHENTSSGSNVPTFLITRSLPAPVADANYLRFPYHLVPFPETFTPCSFYSLLTLPIPFTPASRAIYNRLPYCSLSLPVPFTPGCLLHLPVPLAPAFRTI